VDGNGFPWDLIFYKDLQTRKEAIIFERKIRKRRAKRFLADNDLIRDVAQSGSPALAGGRRGRTKLISTSVQGIHNIQSKKG